MSPLFKRIAPARSISSRAQAMSPGSSSIPRQSSSAITCVLNPSSRVDRAVFHAVIQCEPRQVNFFNSALLQIMGEASVTAIGVIEKCAVAVNPGIDSLVEHVSDWAYVECGGEFSAASRKLCADAPDA